MKMISSRLTNKPSRKERPKSSEKGGKGARKSRDAGTPEKSASPVVFGQDESEVESPAAILQIPTDLDAQPFVINEEDMKSKRLPHPPPAQLPSKRVIVRKQNSEDHQTEEARRRRVLVARKASQLSEPHTLTSVKDKSEEMEEVETIKPHSILGTVHDFQDEMRKRGIEVNTQDFHKAKINILPQREQIDQRTPSPKDELKKDANMNEVRALENWEKRMKERRYQQEHLLRKTRKPLDDLLMNTSDAFRQMQQEREIIDRAIPSIDYGKGYRVGSEFWKQVEKIGGEDNGISMTLTKTEKGFPPPVEHIGKPTNVMMETNGLTERLKNISSHYPWWKSTYLKTRKDELKDVVDILTPHVPYMSELQIVGRGITEQEGEEMTVGNQFYPGDSRTEIYDDDLLEDTNDKEDPFVAYADVVPLPVFGPSLVMKGKSLQWTGSDISDRNKSGPIIRLLFQAPIGGNSLNALDITNDGTAAVYFSWRPLRPADPFGLKKGRPIQRFYFDIRSGVILPGDTIKVRFSFKSPNAGIFSEAWIFETQPVLCGGARVQVALQGIATREDTHVEKRQELERELAKREALHAVDRILKDILSGVRTPPRPSTPIDAYITEKEIFERMNEKLVFDNEIVAQLSALYTNVTDGELWNMSVNDIIQAIKLVEDEEQMESFLETLNGYLGKMSKKRTSPAEKLVFSSSYQLLCDAIDRFCEEAMNLQTSLGMPEKEFIVEQPQEEVVKKGKRGGDKTPDRRQEAKKDKRDLTSPSKGKSIGSSKMRSKDAMITKTEHRGSDTKAEDVDGIHGDKGDSKYKEKLYTILYGILSETAQKIEELALPTPEIESSTPG